MSFRCVLNILILIITTLRSHGATEEITNSNNSDAHHNHDYPVDFDDYQDTDYPTSDYYANDRTMLLTGHEHNHDNENMSSSTGNAYFLKQLESTIPGIPGVDYPLYQSLPDTSFNCQDQRNPGFYGDVEAECQVFHICQEDDRQDSFLCPIGTVFNQMSFVCDWWFNFKCSDTSTYFYLNAQVSEQAGTTPSSVQIREAMNNMRRFRKASRNMAAMMQIVEAMKNFEIGKKRMKNMDDKMVRSMMKTRIRNLFTPKRRTENIWERLQKDENVSYEPKRMSASTTWITLDENNKDTSTTSIGLDHSKLDYKILTTPISRPVNTLVITSININNDIKNPVSDNVPITANISSFVEYENNATELKGNPTSEESNTSIDMPLTEIVNLKSILENTTPSPLNTNITENNLIFSTLREISLNIITDQLVNDTQAGFKERKLEMFTTSNNINQEINYENVTTNIPVDTLSPKVTPTFNPTDSRSRVLPLRNDTHISVTVSIRATGGLSRLKWKRKEDVKKVRKSNHKYTQAHMKNAMPTDLSFRKRTVERKMPKSRIRWIPVRNNNMKHKNFWRMYIMEGPQNIVANSTPEYFDLTVTIPTNKTEMLSLLKAEFLKSSLDPTPVQAEAFENSSSMVLTTPKTNAPLVDVETEVFPTSSTDAEISTSYTPGSPLTTLNIDSNPDVNGTFDSVNFPEKLTACETPNKQTKDSDSKQDQQNSALSDSTNYLRVNGDRTSGIFSETIFGRRSSLGASPSEQWTVKYDPEPDCEEDQDEGNVIRGWSVIIDTGHVTKEKTVKRIKCRKDLRDDRMKILENMRQNRKNVPVDDRSRNFPNQNSLDKKIRFGSMDQQYWLTLVKNWLDAGQMSQDPSKHPHNADFVSHNSYPNEENWSNKLTPQNRQLDSQHFKHPKGGQITNYESGDVKSSQSGRKDWFTEQSSQENFKFPHSNFENSYKNTFEDHKRTVSNNRIKENIHQGYLPSNRGETGISNAWNNPKSNKNFRNLSSQADKKGQSNRGANKAAIKSKNFQTRSNDNLWIGENTNKLKIQKNSNIQDLTSSLSGIKNSWSSESMQNKGQQRFEDIFKKNKFQDSSSIQENPSSGRSLENRKGDWNSAQRKRKPETNRRTNALEQKQIWAEENRNEEVYWMPDNADEGRPVDIMERQSRQIGNRRDSRDWSHDNKQSRNNWSDKEQKEIKPPTYQINENVWAALVSDNKKDLSDSWVNSNEKPFQLDKKDNEWSSNRMQESSDWSQDSRNNGAWSDPTSMNDWMPDRSNTQQMQSTNSRRNENDWQTGNRPDGDYDKSSDNKNIPNSQSSGNKRSEIDWPSEEWLEDTYWMSDDKNMQNFPPSSGARIQNNWSSDSQPDKKDIISTTKNTPDSSKGRKPDWPANGRQNEETWTNKGGSTTPTKQWIDDSRNNRRTKNNMWENPPSWSSDTQRDKTGERKIPSSSENKDWLQGSSKAGGPKGRTINQPKWSQEPVEDTSDWSSGFKSGRSNGNLHMQRMPKESKWLQEPIDDRSDWSSDSKGDRNRGNQPPKSIPKNEADWSQKPIDDNSDWSSSIKGNVNSKVSDTDKGRTGIRSSPPRKQSDWNSNPRNSKGGGDKIEKPSNKDWSAQNSKDDSVSKQHWGNRNGRRNIDDTNINFNRNPGWSQNSKGSSISSANKKGQFQDPSNTQSDWSQDMKKIKINNPASPGGRDARNRGWDSNLGASKNRGKSNWDSQGSNTGNEWGLDMKASSDWSLGKMPDSKEIKRSEGSWQQGPPRASSDNSKGTSFPSKWDSPSSDQKPIDSKVKSDWGSDSTPDLSWEDEKTDSWSKEPRGTFGDKKQRSENSDTGKGGIKSTRPNTFKGSDGMSPGVPWKGVKTVGDSSVKGDTEKKEEKIMWSIQISNNGKLENGWVPITLRPNLKPRANDSSPPKNNKYPSWDQEEDKKKSPESWDEDDNFKITQGPYRNPDTITENYLSSSETPDASGSHQYFIPAAFGNRRFKRNSRSSLIVTNKHQKNFIIHNIMKRENRGNKYENNQYFVASANIVVGEDISKRITEPQNSHVLELLSNWSDFKEPFDQNGAIKRFSPEYSQRKTENETGNLLKLMEESSIKEVWSEPFDSSSLPKSGWIPLIKVVKFDGNKTNILRTNVSEDKTNFKVFPAVNSNNYSSEKSDRTTNLKSNVTTSDANSAMNSAFRLPSPSEITVNHENSTFLKEETLSYEDEEMIVGNETLRIIPFSNVMKQLQNENENSENRLNSEISRQADSKNEWNLPMTSAPKTYSLKQIDPNQVQNRSLGSSWAFKSNATKGMEAWVLVAENNTVLSEKRSFNGSSSVGESPIDHQSSKPLIKKMDIVYKIIVGNRTEEKNSSISKDNERLETMAVHHNTTYSSPIFSPNLKAWYKDSGWTPLFRAVGSVAPANSSSIQARRKPYELI